MAAPCRHWIAFSAGRAQACGKLVLGIFYILKYFQLQCERSPRSTTAGSIPASNKRDIIIRFLPTMVIIRMNSGNNNTLLEVLNLESKMQFL